MKAQAKQSNNFFEEEDFENMDGDDESINNSSILGDIRIYGESDSEDEDEEDEPKRKARKLDNEKDGNKNNADGKTHSKSLSNSATEKKGNSNCNSGGKSNCTVDELQIIITRTTSLCFFQSIQIFTPLTFTNNGRRITVAH